ncbi:unnamed protein product [Allacma fusca]|uniref:Uncharacterized protein n=1 Tax=Allacma fusca TaxID=39272 RepID=A0A8J2P275_9HEXA|nr:unnamed protein product [Allacma fusca]
MLTHYGLVTDNGKKVDWETDISEYEEITDLAKMKVQSSPFSRVDPWRINQALVSWLFQDLNMTPSYNIGRGKPSVSKFTFSVETSDLIITKNLPAFKFITPFGVYLDGKSWGMFGSPFEPDLWLCLGISVVALSAIIAIFSTPPQQRKTNFILRLQYRLLDTIAILIDHCEEYGKDSLESESYNIGIVIELYILMVVVINNAYKGTMSSDFSVEDETKTDFKYFHQLQHFKLYMLVETSVCRYMGRQDVSSDTYLTCTYNNNLWPYCGFYDQLEDERSSLELLGMLTPEKNASALLMKKSSVLADIQSRTFLKCQNNVPDLLAKGPEAKHAFVTTSEDFDYNWDLINSYMNRVSGEKVRLGHNRKVDDGFLSGFEGFLITGGLNKYLHWVPDRMKQVLSSGIYNLWGKWNHIRFPKYRNYTYHSDDGNHPPVPLSLESYDIQCVFYVFLLGISMLPSFCLLGEIFGKRL